MGQCSEIVNLLVDNFAEQYVMTEYSVTTEKSQLLPNIVLPNIWHICWADYSAETTFGLTLEQMNT